MNTIKQLLNPKVETRFLGFFLLLLLLATQSTFAADIKVSVDRNPVSIDDLDRFHADSLNRFKRFAKIILPDEFLCRFRLTYNNRDRSDQ